MWLPHLVPLLVEQLLSPEGLESYELAKRRVEQGLLRAGEREPEPCLVSVIAERRVVRSLYALAASVDSSSSKLHAQFVAVYRAIFLAKVQCVLDAAISGDALIDRLARDLPAGATAKSWACRTSKAQASTSCTAGYPSMRLGGPARGCKARSASRVKTRSWP